jgi:hypothetical protein
MPLNTSFTLFSFQEYFNHASEMEKNLFIIGHFCNGLISLEATVKFFK